LPTSTLGELPSYITLLALLSTPLPLLPRAWAMYRQAAAAAVRLRELESAVPARRTVPASAVSPAGRGSSAGLALDRLSYRFPDPDAGPLGPLPLQPPDTRP